MKKAARLNCLPKKHVKQSLSPHCLEDAAQVETRVPFPTSFTTRLHFLLYYISSLKKCFQFTWSNCQENSFIPYLLLFLSLSCKLLILECTVICSLLLIFIAIFLPAVNVFQLPFLWVIQRAKAIFYFCLLVSLYKPAYYLLLNYRHCFNAHYAF